MSKKWFGAHPRMTSLRFSMRGNRRRWISGSTRSAGNVEPNRATHSRLRAAESSESTIGMKFEWRIGLKPMTMPFLSLYSPRTV